MAQSNVVGRTAHVRREGSCTGFFFFHVAHVLGPSGVSMILSSSESVIAFSRSNIIVGPTTITPAYAHPDCHNALFLTLGAPSEWCSSVHQSADMCGRRRARSVLSVYSAAIALASSLPVSKGRNRRKTYRRHKRQARSSARHQISFFEIVVWLTCAVTATYVVLQNIEWPERNETPKRSRQLTMDEARKFNAAVPFAAGSLRPTKRFVFHGSPAAKLQATECLATAALYEAGRDTRGQRTVIQVVLNRVRHRGFPRTVCGVVYQGSSRRTGCQFTFTCDGSFERRRTRAGWVEARKAAKRALMSERPPITTRIGLFLTGVGRSPRSLKWKPTYSIDSDVCPRLAVQLRARSPPALPVSSL
jgi:hypothetical protein